MGGTIVAHCQICNEKIDWDYQSEDLRVCDDCMEYFGSEMCEEMILDFQERLRRE
jgi:hypothetical protein